MCSEAYAGAGAGGDVDDAYYWSTVYRWVVSDDCALPDPGTCLAFLRFWGHAKDTTV